MQANTSWLFRPYNFWAELRNIYKKIIKIYDALCEQMWVKLFSMHWHGNTYEGTSEK